ncbi:DUF6203 family protein [Nonomuraea glycinis]|uniref:DUF6203 family protein n=1 Tax=Nonomuraea glycinis TaxID=2047744 RepID=UPI0016677E6C|nr:DUF6203 family protein [Nonomuraea glycinis]MCA2176652.1 DUF6203 family protein [Nonomuraea glycinis]
MLRGRGLVMKKFFKFLVARRLARTPIGLAVLGLAWLQRRRRMQRAQPEKAGSARRR